MGQHTRRRIIHWLTMTGLLGGGACFLEVQILRGLGVGALALSGVVGTKEMLQLGGEQRRGGLRGWAGGVWLRWIFDQRMLRRSSCGRGASQNFGLYRFLWLAVVRWVVVVVGIIFWWVCALWLLCFR